MLVHAHYPTGTPLESYVTTIWEVQGMQNCRETILPKGIVEIVFNFADSADVVLPGGTVLTRAPRCFIQGLHTRAISPDYAGQQHLLGLRLHPHRIEEAFGIAASELTNAVVDLTLVHPRFDRMWHRLGQAASFAEKLTILEDELPTLPAAECARSQALSQMFLTDRSAHFQSVDKLARQVCYSTRQLSRVAHKMYGLSAEELTLYKKFVDSVKHIHAGARSLTDVAYSAGFYDQAHFSRVFKSFAGLTPAVYRKNKSELPFHIIA